MRKGAIQRLGRALAGACAMALAAGCAREVRPASARASYAPVRHAADWRQVATFPDRERIRNWRTAWVRALGEARRAGHGARIAAEGRLFEPDAALPGPALPPGDYRCRVTKLGARSAGMLPYVAYPAFACRVRAERELKSFAKLTGSQRPVGLVFPHDDRREVFLGTLLLSDETRTIDYGRDRDRDLAGLVERVGPGRWRLVLPYPRFESLIDVIELVPA